MFPKVGLLEETEGGGEEEKNGREWVMLKYISSVQEQDATAPVGWRQLAV
jgi:hypothetical protein